MSGYDSLDFVVEEIMQEASVSFQIMWMEVVHPDVKLHT
jgi:hypothetical protein